MKNQQKSLFKDFKYLIIGNFGSKILNFLLVPLYTTLLTTEEYGIYDLVNVTILLFIPVLTLGIMDAPARFLLDKDSNKKDIISVAAKKCLYGIAAFWVLLTINLFLNIVPIFSQYYLYIIVLFVAEILYQLGQSFARGMDRLYDVSISGFICSSLILTLNILFLVVLKQGLDGYFIANIISILVSSLYLIVRTKYISEIKIKTINKDVQKDMVKYSKPLVLNSVGWWINNVSDRYVVTIMCGIAANGIYSVAYKIPSILSIIQSIFGQAWTISAVKTYNDENKRNYYSNIYKAYNFLNVIVCSVIIMFNNVIALVLYKQNFYDAWVYTPYLLMSVLFGAMSGVLGGILAGPKDTKVMGRTTIIGAIINIALNIVLIWKMGPMGAAIATMVSYFVVWVLRLKHCMKKEYLNVSYKLDMIVYMLLLVQASISLLDCNLKYLAEAFCMIAIIVLQKNVVVALMRKIKKGKN